MQVTVERPMLFLGKQRTAGETIDSKDEPALLNLSPTVQRALEEADYISTAERKGTASVSAQQMNARIDRIVEQQNRMEQMLEELLSREPSSKGKKG